MTALAGFWSFSGQPAGPQVARMLTSQSVYGRQSKHWSGGEISVGRRLFSLLPEDAFDAGPQISADGNLVLVADVRLDNRDELGAALGIGRAHVLSDAELVLRSFAAWSTDAVKRLRGDFALVLWNARARELVLARDFRGQRPLHYHRSGEFFAFASMPKGLHALPQIPIAPDTAALVGFVALLPETGSETMFLDVKKVEPGHVLRVSASGMSSERYWNPPDTCLRLRDYREYEEALRVELDRAVAVRLRGAGCEVAAHLSAGLDSSAVAATAARVAPDKRVIAYTAVPRTGFEYTLRNTISDEGALSATVASLYPNIEQVLVAASGRSPLDRLDHYFFLFERPLLNICNGVWMCSILDDARTRNLSVLLTGLSGNHTTSYDGMAALSEMLRSFKLGSLVRSAASLIRQGSRVGTVGAQILGPYLPRSLWRKIDKMRGKGRALSDYTCLNNELVPGVAELARQRRFDLAYRPVLNARTARTAALQRVDLGNYNKGMLGGWGVDVRDPLADQQLVELCLSIPTDEYIRGGIPRGLARRAFADRLPPTITQERRKGYQAADWHEALLAARSELAHEVERISDVSSVAHVLDVPRMRKLVGTWPEGNWNTDGRLETYRLALLRAVSTGHFMRRATGSNV